MYEPRLWLAWTAASSLRLAVITAMLAFAALPFQAQQPIPAKLRFLVRCPARNPVAATTKNIHL
jgi:hypothetical protein